MTIDWQQHVAHSFSSHYPHRPLSRRCGYSDHFVTMCGKGTGTGKGVVKVQGTSGKGTGKGKGAHA